MTKPEHVQGSHGRLRTRPIRRRIALLLVIPLTSLLAIWAFSAVTALTSALHRLDFGTAYDRVGGPAGAVIGEVQAERAAAVTALRSRNGEDLKRFRDGGPKTDGAIAAFRSRTLSLKSGTVKGAIAQRLQDLNESFDGLRTLRSKIASGRTTPLAAIEGYSRVIDATNRLQTTLSSIDDIGVYQQAVSLLEIYWSGDFMQREDQLLTTVGARGLAAADRAAFARWAGVRDQYFDLGSKGVEPDIAPPLRQLTDSPSFATYLALESGVVDHGKTPDLRAWRSATTTLSPLWVRVAQKGGEALRQKRIEPIQHGILVRTYLAGGIGLLAVVVSVLLSLLFARRITEELRVLQRTAQELAHERLPRVVARLRRGEPVDVETEAPPPVTGRTLEIAQVADAFSTVQRTALNTAVGEAELRASINQVFINLSWRSQSLLHRQLRLLDQMERRAASAEELDDLFSLDHLTTRMRRHAEGLVILAGAPTARAWDQPVPAEDVVRAAIAEVENYTRVEVIGASSSAVVGEVVADVIHLLAELIENAASFSPPTSEVTVKVETVANGLVVEVVDRGLGLHPVERDALNRRLASAVEFDMVDTERLGLFVVARLAARHGIQVSLEPSPYGGTTAVVLIPHALVSHDDLLQPERSVPGPAGGIRLGRPFRPELPEPASSSPPPVEFPGVGTSRPTGLPSAVNNAARHANGVSPASAPPSWTDAGDPHPNRGAPPSHAGRSVFERREGGSGEWRAEAAGGLEASEVTGRLPRRIPQRSMAPQLRREGAMPEAEGEADFDEPSPELSRNLMDSLQAGWLRGRDTDKDDDDAPIE